MLWKHLAYIPFIIFGFIISLQDWKHKSVNIVPLLLFLISCIFAYCFFKNLCFIPLFIFVVIGILLFLIRNAIAFGAADYITVFSISFLLNREYWLEFIIYCGVIGCITSVIKKEEQFSFISAILLSSAICLFLG
jgi:hypothetical protein